MNEVTKACGMPFVWSYLHPRYWLTWLGLGLSVVVSVLPVSLRHGVGRLFGLLIYRYNTKRASVVSTNLKIAFPGLNDQQRKEMAIRSLQWYGCAMVDYSLLFFSSRRRLSRLISIEGKAQLDEAISNSENVIILLTHSVWLDFAPAGLGGFYQLYGSYKSAKNPVIDWIMAKSRCRYVDSVISREQGMMKLVRSLKPGKSLIFLPDEDLGNEHADFAPFFGCDKATLNTPGRIAKMKKASCFPCFTYFDVQKKQYCIKLGQKLSSFPASDAIVSARILNEGLEDVIKTNPEQYMWLLRYYRTRPQGERGLYTL